MNHKKIIRFTALYHEVTQSSLVSISKATARKKLKKQVKLCNDIDEEKRNDDECELLNSLNDTNIDLQVSNNFAGDKFSYKLSNVSDKMALGEILLELQRTKNLVVGNKILLSVAWCREDERKLFEMFPEVIMFDVTHGTNSEGRPLGVSSSCDGNMEVFTPFRVFMPSECQWVFQWIISTAIPSLLGTESLSRVQLFLTDGDSKIYKCFDNVQPTLYPNAVHGLCVYHLVAQGIDKIKSQFRGLTRVDVINQIKTTKHWIYTWMGIGGVETEDEFSISYKDLSIWLINQQNSSDKEISHNAVIIHNWLIQKIIPHKTRWLFVYRKHLMTLAQKTTSALEGVNQTIKKNLQKLSLQI